MVFTPAWWFGALFSPVAIMAFPLKSAAGFPLSDSHRNRYSGQRLIVSMRQRQMSGIRQDPQTINFVCRLKKQRLIQQRVHPSRSRRIAIAGRDLHPEFEEGVAMAAVKHDRCACLNIQKFADTGPSTGGDGLARNCRHGSARADASAGRCRSLCLLAVMLLLAALILCGCHCRRGYAAEGERYGHALQDAGAEPAVGETGILFAMGGRPDSTSAANNEGQANGNARTTSASEEFVGGSFLGALFFGHPYKGIGIVDIVAGGAILLLVARMVARGKGSSRGGRSFDARSYSVDRSDPEHPSGSDGRLDLTKRPGPPADRPQKQDGRETDNPYDNAWSRRMDSSGRDPEIGKGSQGWNAESRNARPQPPVTMKDRAAAMWAYYGGEHRAAEAPGREAAVASGVVVPQDFDVPDFLEGARTLYVRLQQAWAARKVDELEPFISPQLLELLRKQAAGDPEPVTVDILLVDAELAAISRNGGREEASVNFSVSMRSGTDSAPKDIHELWRFARSPESGGMWRLEGIGQA